MADPLRVGLVGFGLAGRVFHGALLAADPQFDGAVIVTGNPERQEAARHLHLGADVVSTAEEVFSRELDLVVIASPPATHVTLAMAALDAGLAVVVDARSVYPQSTEEQIVAVAQEATTA